MKFPDWELPRETSPFDFPGDRVGVAGVVLLGVAQEGVQVACGGEADAENQRIFGGEDEFVLEGRIEAAFQADLRRVGRAGEGGLRAIGEGPAHWREWGRPGAVGEARLVSEAFDVSSVRGRW